MQTKKRCPKCGREKPLSEFYHNRTANDKHGSYCKSCQKEVDSDNRLLKQFNKRFL